jgi:tyrosine-specific transport protein
MATDSKTFGSALIVAGTTIGAGMLALPITTGVCGYKSMLLLFALIFSLMITCLFILFEANLYMDDPKANIITMSKVLLGTIGESISLVFYLLLLYAASAAYISGGGEYLKLFLDIPIFGCDLLVILALGSLSYLGTGIIDISNRVLMVILLIAYLVLVGLSITHITHIPALPERLGFVIAAIPVVVLAFTSHIILPSIAAYLDFDIKKIKKALIIGNILPLVIYIFWILIIMMLLPSDGSMSLLAISNSKDSLATLAQTLANMGLNCIYSLNIVFSFTALATSLLGVLLSLRDFFADGLKLELTTKNRLYLLLLSTLPPLAVIGLKPELFISAIRYAGVFVAILYVILPSFMVYRARYVLCLPAPKYKFWGGKFCLVFVAILGVLIVMLDFINELGFLKGAI